MRLVTTLCLLALGATACGGNGTGAGGVGDPPVGAWELTSADPPIDVPEGARVTLTIEEVDGRLQAGGTAACNSYGGVLQLDGSTWSLEQVAVTEMACDQPRMAAESAYLDALTAVDTWRRDGDTLTLSGDGTALAFDLLPEVEPADLTGTTWQVDGFIEGAGDDGSVSSGPDGVDRATLRFDEDGTITVTTACRTFTGEWTTAGGQVLVPLLGGDETPVGCEPAALEQERQVLDVLESGGFTASVEGQRLTLVRGEVGLLLRAVE